MAPKAAAKKGPKQQTILASLTALQATYKAASRRHGVPVNKGFAEYIEDKTAILKSVDKVLLTGPTVTGGVLRAVVEALAGYPGVKNVCCFGCSIADEGLLALAQLLKASVDRWYKGSKLRLLEVTKDGAGFPAERWPERFLSHMQGDGKAPIATLGAGFEMPSLLMGVAERVTLETLQNASATATTGAPIDAADIERRFSSLFATTSQHTSVTYQQLNDQTGHQPPPQYTFSLLSLKEFSLSLGAQGLSLQVLSLDHNLLGDEGTRVLSVGLRRCGTLKQLSLSDCGIGPLGSSALCDVLEPDGAPGAAATQPKLQVLNLSRNPLGGAGLAALCPGLARCATLKSIALAGVGLTDEHLPSLQALSDACAANPTIEQVDLDANFIGDQGVALFLPMLSVSPQMRRFRVTDRVGRAVGAQLGAILKANFPGKAKKKKAAPA